MDKRQQGKYRLQARLMNSTHTEWYTDKSRAEARKQELENYRDEFSGESSPFTDIKIEFIPEEEITVERR